MNSNVIINSTKNHRVVVTRHGEPEVLQLIEEDLPEPSAGEVRVKILAAGISAYDLMFRRSGIFPGTPRVPFTLGEDIVGVVDKLGEGVSSFEQGQQVAGATFCLGLGGGYAEFVCLPTSELVPVPPDIDPAEAVCLVVNYLTAHMAMHRAAKVRSGERILVQGAAGGIGTALLDLGKLVGLEMYGTASEYNHDIVSAFGATPIDYRNEDVVDRIRGLTGGGVDVVFDPIGGAGQLRRSYRALRKDGRLVWFGVAATKQKGLRVIPFTLAMLFLLKTIPDGKKAITTPDLDKDNAWYRETLTELLDLLASGKIKPVVAERIPLAEAARAHELLERGGYAGKVVLVTGA
ncbi:MAG TPA: medium chain dehydrogenase/reductase family protein [candidate division Zixibacteria bacterium]|nr:medium chain dehydrogenase/reductase family protein [candidate division Zixibacteria bacterium]